MYLSPARRIIGIAILGAIAILVACTPTAPASVTSISIDGGDRTIVLGDSLTLTATVATTGAASSDVTWASSDESVATVDADGVVTSLSDGSTDITATSAFDAGVSDTIVLTVDPQGALRWTRQFGTSGNEAAIGIATDANGNVYTSGFTDGNLEGTGAAATDAFVRSYDGAGDVRWTRQFGTSGLDIGAGIATDAGGNVYVAGYTAGVLEGANAGGFDAFVRSYDGAGNVRWTRQFGTSSTDVATGIATDANGNVYVAGYTFGALEGATAGSFDAFVRSYDSEGNLRWTRQFGTVASDSATGIATDAGGNVYVTGSTSGALEGANAGSSDSFIRSYDSEGNLRWTRQFGTSSDDSATGIATDANGNVYVSGYTNGALEGTNSGSRDAFVRSYDGAGNVRWTRQFGTTDDDDALGIAADASGNVYVAGYTEGALEGVSAGGNDAFVRGYDADGGLRWAGQFGTEFEDYANGIATDAGGNVYVAGYTTGDLEGVSAGFDDAFIRSFGR